MPKSGGRYENNNNNNSGNNNDDDNNSNNNNNNNNPPRNGVPIDEYQTRGKDPTPYYVIIILISSPTFGPSIAIMFRY